MMKHFIKVAMLLCVVAVLLSVLSFKTTQAKAAPSGGEVLQNGFISSTCGKWGVVPSPNSNIVPDGLSGVAAVSASDGGAVGGYGSQRGGRQALLEHWDGAHRQIDTRPSPGSMYNRLNGVTALSVAAAWAVGYFVSPTGITQTLIEYWNGTKWSFAGGPNVGAYDNYLNGVVEVSPNDVWAGGTDNGPTLMHWDGSHWAQLSLPTQNGDGSYILGGFSGLAALSEAETWAVGGLQNGTVSGNASVSFIMRLSRVPCVTPTIPLPGPVATP